MVYNGTELSASELEKVGRQRVQNLSGVAQEINAATMPDTYWRAMHEFLTKLWLPGSGKTGIWHNDQLMIHPMDIKPNKPMVFIRDILLMPYKVHTALQIPIVIQVLWSDPVILSAASVRDRHRWYVGWFHPPALWPAVSCIPQEDAVIR